MPDDNNICAFFNQGGMSIQGQILPILTIHAPGIVWVSRGDRIGLLSVREAINDETASVSEK